MKEKILKYCLENASTASVQRAVKDFRPMQIAYDLKLYLCPEFNLHKGIEFANVVSDAFEIYKAPQIELIELERKIKDVRLCLKTMGRFHSRYEEKVVEHDALCILNNKLNEPITQFLKDYKKAQRLVGKKISVRKRKQPRFYNPFK